MEVEASTSSTDIWLGVVLYFCFKPFHLCPAEVPFAEPMLTDSCKTELCGTLGDRGKAALNLEIGHGQVTPLNYVLAVLPQLSSERATRKLSNGDTAKVPAWSVSQCPHYQKPHMGGFFYDCESEKSYFL